MPRTKTVEGTINVEAHLECPHCGTYVDLFEIEELNKYGLLHSVINRDNKEEQEQYKELIDCPDCFKKIQIEGLSY